MSSNALSFNCALITGGGGGIGRAMAKYLISLNKKVIIVGRTESTLAKTALELGHNTTYYILNTGDIPSISPLVQKVIKEHPDLDCLINNAGVQRQLDVHNFDLAKADEEININIRGPMHLAISFLDHFKTKTNGATIINISSILAFIPFSLTNPVYNGTKSFLHFWTMNLRSQLKKSPSSKHIMVVEIAPPTVGTDLHRDRADPDDNKKGKNEMALTVEEFMEFVKRGLESGREIIGAGSSEVVVERWQSEFGGQYGEAERNFLEG